MSVFLREPGVLPRFGRARLSALTMMMALVLAACSRSEAPTMTPPTPVVSAWTVTAQPLEMQSTLPGRAVAFMESEVRPQVGGIIQKRLFTEGETVKAGQVLYQLDPARSQATYDKAVADLAQAEAAVLSARPKAQRYANLVKLDAVSQQDLDEAQATLRQAEASVLAARATMQSAKVDLDDTRITAPISGRIGTSAFTPGALVTASQTTALATIRQLDPIYVDATQTSAQLLALRKQMDSGALQAVDGKVPVSIVLEDGSTYDHQGTLAFIGSSVDTGTGNVALRMVVPNPDGLLLPGTYVRARLPMALSQSAVLVPQTAMSRNTKGEGTVLLVGDDGKVVQRVIEVGEAMGDQWVVSSGLSAGERLIVAGGSKVKAGDTVTVQTVEKPVAASTADAQSPAALGE